MNSDPLYEDMVELLNTEIASLAIWDAKQVAAQGVNSYEKLLKVYEAGMPELNQRAIVFETGTDGGFQVTIRRNKGLTTDEKKLLCQQMLGFDFTVKSAVYIGDPSYVGNEQEGLKEKSLRKVFLTKGRYVIDVYSILTRTNDGQPEYLQFVLCIYDKLSYPDKKRRTFSKVLRLQNPDLTNAALDKLSQKRRSERINKSRRERDFALGLGDRLDDIEKNMAGSIAALLVPASPRAWKSIYCKLDFYKNSTRYEAHAMSFGGRQEFLRNSSEIFDVLQSYGGKQISPSYLWISVVITITRRAFFGKGKMSYHFERSHGKPQEFTLKPMR